MKPHFSGYATKAGLLCTDGRTIMPDAFKHQDQMRVPLVWMHGHTDVENVLGHAILENRNGDIYTYGFFNDSQKAKHAHGLLEHGDINSLSVWANQLIERDHKVIHGAIREVSLVLAGANPGATIDMVTLRHSDGSTTDLDDEVIIHTGLIVDVIEGDDETANTDAKDDAELQHADAPSEDATILDIYESMSNVQKDVLHFMLGQALETATTDNTAAHGNLTDTEGNTMEHKNIFEGKTPASTDVLSHDALNQIVASAERIGSMKAAVIDYGIKHNITNIEELFPDAKAITDTPEWISRRTEWVASFLGSVRKSRFSRIKTVTADITMEDARAKGYITGNMKKEEFFSVSKRVTTPTTVYKKQALDRDDMIDITDFDVVTWLKAEMRVMLDEEIARASLIGDGRDIASEDKINEQNIRPIAKDHELYTTTVNVNVGDASSSMNEVVDAVIMNRYKYKGSGNPNFYTTEYWIARFLTMRNPLTNERVYKNLSDLAVDLRVNAVIPVEVMGEEPDIIGIIVNPVDYVLGADSGGEVTMFDDFDIDYNKQKYLIETRLSGALVKPKSAMVIKSMVGTDTLVVPVAPTFVEATGALTITNTTGVVYKNGAGTTINAAGSPYTVAPGATYVVNATPAATYYFNTSDDDSWTFTRPA